MGMKFSKKDILNLSLDAYFRRSSDDRYTAEEREAGLHAYLQDLGKDFRRNENEIYEIIEETANVILPAKVGDIFKMFADFKTVKDGDIIRWRVKNGKIKAHIMAVGSVAERQRVDHGFITTSPVNVQAKIYDYYDRFISGQVDWAEMMNDVIDAIMERIMQLVQESFEGIYNRLPETNMHSSPSDQFDETEFKKIINVVKSYGQPVIMGTPLALSNIPLDSTLASEADKLDIRNKGVLGMYRGCPVIEMPNSFEDETNETPVLDDNNIYVIPSGKEKVVKVALEGGLHTRAVDGADWTINFEAYQKAAVTMLFVNHIGLYRFTE